MFNYILENKETFMELVRQHLEMVIWSAIAALIMGVFLGILASRVRKVSRIIIMLANVIQSIPELVLLGLSIPLLGIGFLPAFCVLFLKELLPILLNTYVGITSVEPSTIEAARGMGMTGGQILFRIELPLARKVIFTGFRIAVVQAVAIAALGSVIGSGGLGDWIQQGMTLYDYNMIFAGAVPVTVLALIADLIASRLIKVSTPKGVR